jgi:photosystem II stability/assembly factor-like uncharacterized protein
MSVLLMVGTKRGLFTLRSSAERAAWVISGPQLVGRAVYHALIDPRDQTMWAATNHPVWGAHLHASRDYGESWELLEAAPHYADERGLKAIWHITPGHASQPDTMYAGIEPAGLVVSHDRGRSWQGVDALNQHPTTSLWQPAGGALALHSIIVDATAAHRILCAVSAGGVYRSDDEGASWTPINQNVRADFQPAQYPVAGQCVHKLLQHPATPERLYQQNHCGVYRSDDRGDTWIEITSGLPSEFGYALATDARDPDTVFVIPEESSDMRSTIEGKLRVYRTRDAGNSWQALKRGLPQENAYVSILREGMCADDLDPCGVYFGTSGGHVFASRNAGESWTAIAAFLPRILSVTAAVVG